MHASTPRRTGIMDGRWSWRSVVRVSGRRSNRLPPERAIAGRSISPVEWRSDASMRLPEAGGLRHGRRWRKATGLVAPGGREHAHAGNVGHGPVRRTCRAGKMLPADPDRQARCCSGGLLRRATPSAADGAWAATWRRLDSTIWPGSGLTPARTGAAPAAYEVRGGGIPTRCRIWLE